MGKEAESIYAYTPGLKVKRVMKLEKLRRLPIPGEVLVKCGDDVSCDTIVARTFVPGNPTLIRIFNLLGCEPDEVKQYMKKKEGDNVEEGEVIAGYSSFFGLMKKAIPAPCSGTIESVSEVTGQIILREAPTPVQIKAYIAGKCVRALEKEGAVIETNAAYIQGIFGFGGETHGDLQVVVESPKDVLSADIVNESHKDKILVGGSLVTREALEKAIQVGAKGVVVGSIYDKDMTEFLGYEIGVAITGHEEVGTTVIITEGFGEMNMAQRTFDILKSFDGYHASISGATQIRAGVMRPEIIIPHTLAFPPKKELEEELASGMKAGTVVRIIREPYFGDIGQVSRLPVELQQIETLSKVRVLDVTLEDGRTVTVPRANVEIIEE